MSPKEHRETKARRDHGVRVREAVEQDASEIARIYNYYVDVSGATFDSKHWTEDQVRTLVDCQMPECWLVATDEDIVIGWASVRPYSLRFGYRYSCETAIYLEAARVGCGVGDALQARLEEHCRQSGIHHAVAKIIAGNEPSLAFHRRHGYEMVGIQKEIGQMNGEWVDVAILQKLFG
jgi:L-amino acid N-acyltransferase YncA